MTTITTLLSGLRVLLVEDEAMVAMMIEDMLSELGCVVAGVAGTVARGLALADDPGLQIDGALLDVNLGGETVYPVAKALSARGVPFVFSTGYSTAGIEACFEHVPILPKPYESNELGAMLMLAMKRGGAAARA
jgi:CheY-like chemotaxis protein